MDTFVDKNGVPWFLDWDNANREFWGTAVSGAYPFSPADANSKRNQRAVVGPVAMPDPSYVYDSTSKIPAPYRDQLISLIGNWASLHYPQPWWIGPGAPKLRSPSIDPNGQPAGYFAMYDPNYVYWKLDYDPGGFNATNPMPDAYALPPLTGFTYPGMIAYGTYGKSDQYSYDFKEGDVLHKERPFVRVPDSRYVGNTANPQSQFQELIGAINQWANAHKSNVIPPKESSLPLPPVVSKTPGGIVKASYFADRSQSSIISVIVMGLGVGAAVVLIANAYNSYSVRNR
jgi:hypothetical protein